MIYPGHSYEQAIEEALGDSSLQTSLNTHLVRRSQIVQESLLELGEPDRFRGLAQRIKQYSVSHLDELLSRFCDRFEGLGGVVHWAADGEEAKRIIVDIARQHGCKRCVKSKSMVSEEIELNEALIAAGIETVETDLGEFIIQLSNDRPSHIITPMIHITRAEVARLFQEKLGTHYTEDPEELTQIARRHLREKFHQGDLGITGVNFAVAETGSLCLVTNEGNGRMVSSCPRVHIALMGMEKVIPTMRDLGVLFKVFVRSAVGTRLTVYTTIISGPRGQEGVDGPEHLHVVILNNRRSEVLSSSYRDLLGCLRCGACLNVCPVYRKIGGHAYGSVYSGPIGAAETPLLAGMASGMETMPELCSLCGACLEICPVKIDLPRDLIGLRSEFVEEGRGSVWMRLAMGFSAWFLSGPRRFRLAQRVGRFVLRRMGQGGWVRRLRFYGSKWTASRDFPVPARETFREMWKASEGEL